MGTNYKGCTDAQYQQPPSSQYSPSLFDQVHFYIMLKGHHRSCIHKIVAYLYSRLCKCVSFFKVRISLYNNTGGIIGIYSLFLFFCQTQEFGTCSYFWEWIEQKVFSTEAIFANISNNSLINFTYRDELQNRYILFWGIYWVPINCLLIVEIL